jgi:hypothetical protein
MTRSCSECLHHELPDWNVTEYGKCLLSKKKKFDREVRVSPRWPACKGFEKKDQGRKR